MKSENNTTTSLEEKNKSTSLESPGVNTTYLDITKRKYTSPVDFMKDYVDLFNSQIDNPKKIFFREIEYAKDYEQSLFNYLINISSQDNIDLSKYKEIENILKRQKYHDVIFYDTSILQYTKGIAFLLDRVDMEVVNGIFKNVDILYFFCSWSLDLTETIIRKIYIREDGISIDWSKFLNNIELINRKLANLDQSLIYSTLELSIRYSPSDILMGDRRVEKYTIGKCLIHFINDLEKTVEEKYVLSTNIMGEMITRRIGNDEDVNIIKKYSDRLIR